MLGKLDTPKRKGYCKGSFIMEAIISMYFGHFNLKYVTCISSNKLHQRTSTGRDIEVWKVFE